MRGPIGSPFDAHSPEAQAISSLFVKTLLICSVIGVVVAALVAWCVIKFRAKEGAKEPAQVHGSTRLEIAWTIVPFLIVVWIFVLTVQAAGASDPPADRTPDLVIIGHQWWWEVRYPNGAITANEIHIPTGKKLLVRVESADVVHDFWVPQLARKIDAVPGHPSTIWMSADAPGTYLGACAEYCGMEHAWMRIVVEAQNQGDFDAWAEHQLDAAPAPTTTQQSNGLTLFTQKTCIQCHAVTGLPVLARVAPDLTHLAARKTIGAGVVLNTPTELGRWLQHPQQIKPGSHMPDLQLTDAEVADFVAWFETLR